MLPHMSKTALFRKSLTTPGLFFTPEKQNLLQQNHKFWYKISSAQNIFEKKNNNLYIILE